MQKYISHFSAAYYWNIKNIDNIFESNQVRQYQDNHVVDITFTNSVKRNFETGYNVHSCSFDLPSGAIKKKNGFYVSSPELVFIELANKLDIQRLILLGLQMCSHPLNKESEGLTSRRKLITFLNKVSGMNGHKKAKRALKYIENGSNSIMESLAFMFLTLPNSLGGYGLSGAIFNHKIRLDKIGRNQLKQHHCFVDLYYKREKLAIEYDSFKHHQSPLQQSKDMKRTTTLERQGFKVLSFGTIQLYDKDARLEFLTTVAKHLKRRIRIQSKKFDILQEYINELLP